MNNNENKQKPIWHFPSREGERTANYMAPAASKIFKENPWISFARELIQNSYDAKLDNDSPAKIEFKKVKLKTNEFPGLEEFKYVIERCLEEKDSQSQSRQELAYGLEQLKLDKIDCIKVTDSNTTGLSGFEHDDSGGKNYWEALIWHNGNSTKSTGNSGGSQGVGKNAPFNFTAINTIFYSTIVGDKFAFQGVAKLFTWHDENNAKMSHEGNYINYINKSQNSISDKNSISPTFHLERQGTSLLIPIIPKQYADAKDNVHMKNDIIKSVISNFFVAIDRNKLEIDIFGEIISSDTLDEKMNDLLDYSDQSYNYYVAYKNAKSESEDCHYDLNGELGAEIFVVKRGDSFPNIQKKFYNIMKSKGMLIEDKRINSAYRDFAAVVVIRDDERCELLTKTENEKHDKFDVDSVYDDSIKKEAVKYLNSINNWAKQTISEFVDIEDKDETEIYGIDEYFDLSKGIDNETNELDENNVTIGDIIVDKPRNLRGSSTEDEEHLANDDSGNISTDGESEDGGNNNGGTGGNVPKDGGGFKGNFKVEPKFMGNNEKIISKFTIDKKCNGILKILTIDEDKKIGFIPNVKNIKINGESAIGDNENGYHVNFNESQKVKLEFNVNGEHRFNYHIDMKINKEDENEA